MKSLFSTACLMIVAVISIVTACYGSSYETSWGWKRSETPDDVIDFLNRKRTYRQKIRRAEITAADKATYVDFIAFYQSDPRGDEPQSWSLKRATTPNDVLNFLNTKPPYTRNIKRAEIAAANRGTHVDFFVFYQSDPNTSKTANWAWKRATSADDVVSFLNTEQPYPGQIKRVEITAVKRGSYIDFVVFYQTGEGGNDVSWGCKKSTTEDDVKAFLSGEGSYSQPVASAEVVAVRMSAHTEYYVFYTRSDEKRGRTPNDGHS